MTISLDARFAPQPALRGMEPDDIDLAGAIRVDAPRHESAEALRLDHWRQAAEAELKDSVHVSGEVAVSPTLHSSVAGHFIPADPDDYDPDHPLAPWIMNVRIVDRIDGASFVAEGRLIETAEALEIMASGTGSVGLVLPEDFDPNDPRNPWMQGLREMARLDAREPVAILRGGEVTSGAEWAERVQVESESFVFIEEVAPCFGDGRGPIIVFDPLETVYVEGEWRCGNEPIVIEPGEPFPDFGGTCPGMGPLLDMGALLMG